MQQTILSEATQDKAQLIEWRRALHQMPELGLELSGTAAYVQSELKKMGIACERTVGGACLSATLGKEDGKCILLRADMDALPIREETGLPFQSESGRMHACGHDLHTAILLGAAKVLKAREDTLCGKVKLLFQPGEETFIGAQAAISEGILENPAPDAAFAVHVSPNVTPGVILYGQEAMSSAYGFQITIHGKGGHGSQPDKCIDPISVGVQVHLALQELISRECPPTTHAALTIGQFQAGEVANVIPETALLRGTLRTFDPKVTELLIRRIGEVVPAVAGAFRASATVEVLYNVPPVRCDMELANFFVNTLSALETPPRFMNIFHAMGSEDFAFFSERIPSAYFCLGAAPCALSQAVWPHNPKTMFSEDCLPLGVAVYAQGAVDWLRENAVKTAG